ncbi:MAG: cysteine desulfurase [Clostridia bacterium]|nr:cysteine desulfurase [Clostridia bacterium]
MEIIYLDHAATGVPLPCAERAFIEASRDYGNPSSLHIAGAKAKETLEKSRSDIAKTLSCKPEEIIFTSGGSESNNQAIIGAARLKGRRSKRVIISDSEHPSVENAANSLIREGFEVIKIPTVNGELDLELLEGALKTPAALVCVMLVNNETGAVYDIAAVRKAIDASGSDAIFHCDAVQGYLKTEKYKLLKKYCDTASFSAHKIGGYKGVGALYIKSGLRLPPLICGGGQESGLRSGTENVQGVAAFAAAAKACSPEEAEKLKDLRNITVKTLVSEDFGAVIRNAPEQSAAILSISVPGVRSEVMLNALSAEGICVSAGSACSASRKGTSRVIEAFGATKEELESAIRISFGVSNTEDECVHAAKRIAYYAKRLRR